VRQGFTVYRGVGTVIRNDIQARQRRGLLAGLVLVCAAAAPAAGQAPAPVSSLRAVDVLQGQIARFVAALPSRSISDEPIRVNGKGTGSDRLRRRPAPGNQER
jgi:hypothetical protein